MYHLYTCIRRRFQGFFGQLVQKGYVVKCSVNLRRIEFFLNMLNELFYSDFWHIKARAYFIGSTKSKTKFCPQSYKGQFGVFKGTCLFDGFKKSIFFTFSESTIFQKYSLKISRRFEHYLRRYMI